MRGPQCPNTSRSLYPGPHHPNGMCAKVQAGDGDERRVAAASAGRPACRACSVGRTRRAAAQDAKTQSGLCCTMRCQAEAAAHGARATPAAAPAERALRARHGRTAERAPLALGLVEGGLVELGLLLGLLPLPALAARLGKLVVGGRRVVLAVILLRVGALAMQPRALRGRPRKACVTGGCGCACRHSSLLTARRTLVEQRAGAARSAATQGPDWRTGAGTAPVPLRTRCPLGPAVRCGPRPVPAARLSSRARPTRLCAWQALGGAGAAACGAGER